MSDNTLTVPSPPPTLLRQWFPCIAMLLLSLLSYVDRSVLAILSPTILADLHLSATQYGYAITAFSLCYMVANPIWGLWMDRFGLWIITLVAVLLWTLASGGHALILGITGLCIGRGLLGFGEGATFPAGLKTVTETLPPSQRSLGLGIAYSGGSLGATLTPLLVTPIAIRYGWRSAFALTGILGLLWIALWTALRFTGWHTSSTPTISAADSTRLTESTSRWSRNLVAIALIYGLGAAPLAFGLYAAPLYLTRVLHLSQASLGHLLWIPPAGWEAGYLFFGRLADHRRLSQTTHSHLRRPTGVFLLLSFAGSLILLAPAAAAGSYPVAATMLLFFLQMFIGGGFVVFALSDGMDTIAKRHSAFLSGVCISIWALTTGILMPVLGHLFDQRRYTLTFWIVAALPPTGTLFWHLLKTSNPRPIQNV